MRTRVPLATLALCGVAALAVASASAAPESPSPRSGPSDMPQDDARLRADSDLPTNRPIVATVVEVDEDAGRVTLDTAHGQVALEISEDVAQRLSPGDVVVLRLSDDDGDFPSAAPREDPPAREKGPTPASPNKI